MRCAARAPAVCWCTDASLSLHTSSTPPNLHPPRPGPQSNSEHSRHWFFRGDIVLDGERMPHNLMDIVKAPLEVGRGCDATRRSAGAVCCGAVMRRERMRHSLMDIVKAPLEVDWALK